MSQLRVDSITNEEGTGSPEFSFGITIKSSDSGTGKLTIAAPVTNENRTLTLPDSDGDLVTTETAVTTGKAIAMAIVFG